MNEFTKKELIALEHALYVQVEEHDPEKLEDSPLLLKIQSMIDNYCEHQNKCIDGVILVCEECGKEW